MVKTPLVAWIALGLAGCASQPRVGDSVGLSTAGFPACTAPPSATDTLWREVRAAGFTFCVPASWRSDGPAAGAELDPRTWRTSTIPGEPSSASITWGTGVPPTLFETRTQTVVSGGGGELPQRSTTVVPAGPGLRHTEVLGGRTAEVSEWIAEGPVHYSEARWHDPAVYLRGETRSEMWAHTLLAIHRTVRFTPAPPP
jgi:hypothetical protein